MDSVPRLPVALMAEKWEGLQVHHIQESDLGRICKKNCFEEDTTDILQTVSSKYRGIVVTNLILIV